MREIGAGRGFFKVRHHAFVVARDPARAVSGQGGGVWDSVQFAVAADWYACVCSCKTHISATAEKNITSACGAEHWGLPFGGLTLSPTVGA